MNQNQHVLIFVMLVIVKLFYRPPEDLPKATLYENIPSKEKKIAAGLTIQTVAPVPPPRKT